jgi:hypothetical protein
MRTFKRLMRNIVIVLAAYSLSQSLTLWLLLEVIGSDLRLGMTWLSFAAAVFGGLAVTDVAMRFNAKEPGGVGFVVGVVLAFSGNSSVLIVLPVYVAAGAYLLVNGKRLARVKKLRARQAEVYKARRERRRAANHAADSIDTVWLIDALRAAEATDRADLIARLTPESAFGLARLHRRGIPAEFVARNWSLDEPMTDEAADLLTAVFREARAIS